MSVEPEISLARQRLQQCREIELTRRSSKKFVNGYPTSSFAYICCDLYNSKRRPEKLKFVGNLIIVITVQLISV